MNQVCESTQTDEQLAAAAQRRDAAASRAFEELYRRHARLVLAFLAARCPRGIDAADLAQQAWLRVWEKLPTHFIGKHFRGWLHEIARNLLFDDSRKRKPHLLADGYDAPTVDEHDCDDGCGERTQALRQCLEALDETRRPIVTLRLEGTSFDEISARLGVERSTAMTRFHRAKEFLRDCLTRKLS